MGACPNPRGAAYVRGLLASSALHHVTMHGVRKSSTYLDGKKRCISFVYVCECVRTCVGACVRA